MQSLFKDYQEPITWSQVQAHYNLKTVVAVRNLHFLSHFYLRTSFMILSRMQAFES